MRGMELHEIAVRKRRHREHHNSRNGCLQCKARKVKVVLHVPDLPVHGGCSPSVLQCDEEKPKCRSCTRRATSCTYTNNTGLNQLARAAQVTSPYNNPERGPVFAPPRYNDGHGGFTPDGDHVLQPDSPLPVAQPPSSPLALNMDHLQLLHHFIAVTSHTLGDEAWKLAIPQVALSHHFLMHSILALAALHIAYLGPEPRLSYWEMADMHHDRALNLQQEAMAKPNPDNADALFAFSLSVIYFALGSSIDSNSLESEEPLADVITCISKIRGIRYVLPHVQQWVEEGALAPLLPFHPGNVKTNHSLNDHDTDRYLQKVLVLCSTGFDMNKTNEVEDIEQYAAAASILRVCLLQAEPVPDGAPRKPQIWHWASRLTPEFLQRLGKLHPIPLVLVAHWCVILAQIPQEWWIHGWVDHIMARVHRHLPEEYHEWLDWPTKKIKEQRNSWATRQT